MEVNIGDHNANQRTLRYFHTYAAVDPVNVTLHPETFMVPTPHSGLPVLIENRMMFPDMIARQLDDQPDEIHRAEGGYEAVNNEGMMWVDVRGSNLDFETNEVSRIALNRCGQWVKEDDPNLICGNTGWYRPYTFTEAKVMQIYKQGQYRGREDNVPKPGCHMAGPKCIQQQQTAGMADSCGRRPRAFKPRRLNCSTGTCF